MSEAFSAVRVRGQQLLTYLVEEVSLTVYFAAFIAVIVVCGWLYAALGGYGHGLNAESLSLWDGIYFSVVTISSLGYGDLSPVGASRAVAGLEVLFGLFFLGVFVAKITSRRLSYHVKRLFASDAQRRLDEFAERFVALEARLSDNMKGLGQAYERTPEPRPPSDAQVSALPDFSESVARLYAASEALRAYLVAEVQNDRYFSIAPQEAVRRLGSAVDATLFQLGQLIISLPVEAKPVILTSDVRHRIWGVLSAQQSVAETVERNCKEADTILCFGRVRSTCESVMRGHFATPGDVRAVGLPNQEVPASDAPQGQQG